MNDIPTTLSKIKLDLSPTPSQETPPAEGGPPGLPRAPQVVKEALRIAQPRRVQGLRPVRLLPHDAAHLQTKGALRVRPGGLLLVFGMLLFRILIMKRR